MQTYNEEDVREFGGGEEALPPEEPEEIEEPELELSGDSDELSDDNLEEGESAQRREEGVIPESQHKKVKARLNHAQREKYQALDALNRAQEELERMRSLTDLTAQSAMRHYDDNVIKRFEKARELKAQAYEAGDVQGQVDADVELSMATNELHNLNTWKAQQSFKQQTPEPYYEPPAYVGKEPIIQDWVRENTWISPHSSDYDPDLSDQVAKYCEQFDNNLMNAGYGNAIFSPEYLDKVNEFVDTVRQSYSNGGRRDLNMRATRSPVSPVRSGHNFQQQSQRHSLNAEERAIAKSLGITDKVYLASKLNDIKNNQHRRGGR